MDIKKFISDNYGKVLKINRSKEIVEYIPILGQAEELYNVVFTDGTSCDCFTFDTGLCLTMKIGQYSDEDFVSFGKSERVTIRCDEANGLLNQNNIITSEEYSEVLFNARRISDEMCYDFIL